MTRLLSAALPSGPTSRFTVFSFLWACQALIHQEFYSQWLGANDWAGWLLTVLGLLVLVRPSSIGLFSALLAASIVYNVRKWPFVVNHILMESVIDLTLLVAIAASARLEGGFARLARFEAKERVYERFAPVLRTMMVVMYAFAILAKLNRDFFDPTVSCASVLYEDLVRRLPFLSTSTTARTFAIWGTLAIEAALPLLFAFRRTWKLALIIGLPFHLMLGAIGHRTFSGLAYALYSLFVMDQLVPLVDATRERIVARFGAERVSLALGLARVVAVGGTAVLIALSLAGLAREKIGPLAAYRVPWVVWGLWSLFVGGAMLAAARRLPDARPASALAPPARLRWLYALVLLLVLNGIAPYVGLKTETCFTMYSNLRTEARRTNHLIVPVMRIAGYQDDLVEVLESDHPDLERYVGHQLGLTYFEFHRFTSSATGDFRVRYRRNGGEPQEFTKRDGAGSDPELSRPPPLLARKLLFFRPVSWETCVPCMH